MKKLLPWCKFLPFAILLAALASHRPGFREKPVSGGLPLPIKPLSAVCLVYGHALVFHLRGTDPFRAQLPITPSAALLKSLNYQLLLRKSLQKLRCSTLEN